MVNLEAGYVGCHSYVCWSPFDYMKQFTFFTFPVKFLPTLDGSKKNDALCDKLLILSMQQVNLPLVPYYPGISAIELLFFFS